jgi:hypothetical protein
MRGCTKPVLGTKYQTRVCRHTAELLVMAQLQMRTGEKSQQIRDAVNTHQNSSHAASHNYCPSKHVLFSWQCRNAVRSSWNPASSRTACVSTSDQQKQTRLRLSILYHLKTAKVLASVH